MPSAIPPPRDLSKPFRDLWTKTRQALVKDNHWHDSDAELLSRYVRDLEMAALALAGMRDEKGRLVLTVPGSKGQDAPHPNIKTYHDATTRADARARMLLLSPEARSKASEPTKAPARGSKFGL